jgi:hypothetical protein
VRTRQLGRATTPSRSIGVLEKCRFPAALARPYAADLRFQGAVSRRSQPALLTKRFTSYTAGNLAIASATSAFRIKSWQSGTRGRRLLADGRLMIVDSWVLTALIQAEEPHPLRVAAAMAAQAELERAQAAK